MSRNAAAFQPSRNSFKDALESTIGLSAGLAATDEDSRNTSTGKRWNQAALRRAVRRLQSRAAQGEPARASSSVTAKPDQILSSNESTLSYERALRLLARVNLDSDDLELSKDTGLDNADRKGSKSRRPTAKIQQAAASADPPDTAKHELRASSPSNRLKGKGLHETSRHTPGPVDRLKHGKVCAGECVSAAGASDEEVTRQFSEKIAAQPDSGTSLPVRKPKQPTGSASAVAAKGSRKPAQGNSAKGSSLVKQNASQQRRTVVSLRLTEEELEQLRLRADESGINVSAYVRSCVTEAENLRSQVRQVVEEIRCLSAASMIQQRALPILTERKSIDKGNWMQSLWQTASRVCFYPFALFRRTA